MNDRKELSKLNGQRMRFRATVERFGTKTNWNGYPENTILLRAVARADTGDQVADHLWFTVGSVWLGVKEGDTVEFDARVGGYEKGYVNHRQYIDERQWSWKLNRPTKIEVFAQEGEEQVEELKEARNDP